MRRREYAVANHLLQTYIPLFVYSQCLGWRRKGEKEICPVKTCCRKLFLQDTSLSAAGVLSKKRKC